MAAPFNTWIFGSGQRYVVTGAAVVARKLSGGESYIYRNGLLPADTDPSHIDQLITLGLVRKLEGTAS